MDQNKQPLTSSNTSSLQHQSLSSLIKPSIFDYASAYATGAILSQLCDDGKWRPIGFVSKSILDTEHNYAIYDKELLSIICSLEEWRYILEGTKHKIEILNDHQNLTYFCTAQNLNHHQACWSLYLSCFDFALIHRPGCNSAKPKALS